MADPNRFGLPRAIPEAVKREVRRRSKFGCVLCRFAVCQYEHIDPVYVDAKSHEADAMCLLCASCHDRVTRGRISKAQVLARYSEIQSDPAVKAPFEELALTTSPLLVRIGSMYFHQASTLIRINGEYLLSIAPSESGIGLPSLSGLFYDANGNQILAIENNVWSGTLEAWDLTVEANRVVIRTAPGCIALELTINPPNEVWITRLNMFYRGCHIYSDREQVRLGYATGPDQYRYLGFENFSCIGAKVGLDFDLRQVGLNPSLNLSIIGGKGISIEGAGLNVGVGAGQMVIASLRLWDTGIQPRLGND